MTRRQILRQYILSLTVLFCLLAFFCGIITVKEKTEYNISLTPYSQLAVENEEAYIKISLDERELIFEKAQLLNSAKSGGYAILGEFFEYMANFFKKM